MNYNCNYYYYKITWKFSKSAWIIHGFSDDIYDANNTMDFPRKILKISK